MSELPVLDSSRLPARERPVRPLRFLLLYGSLRPNSLSHLVVAEAGRLLERLGGDVRIYNPVDLPMPGSASPTHPKIAELHEAIMWSDAQLWCSPENFGGPSAVLKAQIDSCPPVIGGTPLFKGKPLATAQVNGAAATFTTALALSATGRWLEMLVTPTLFALAKAQEQFGEDGRMKASPDYDRLVDLVEELFKVTEATQPLRADLCDAYSKRTAG